MRTIGRWAVALGAGLAAFGAIRAEAAEPADYAKSENWLCWPGRQDACSADQTTGIVSADGNVKVVPFVPAEDPEIDCFYVYPTVSLDPTPNSDLVAGPEEKSVAAHQFARFGSVCRTFAPLYRQVTLTALRAFMEGKTADVDRTLGYNDVLAAWNHYLATENNGRRVVLIGHSQGSGVLKALIQQEIDGKPDQAKILLAMLIGANMAVPRGALVGGDFKSMPLCSKTGETGCIVTYVSFRAEAPPPANTRFGRVPGEGMVAGCTNPAALEGGSAPLDAYLSTGIGPDASNPNGATTPVAWSSTTAVTTPFVRVPLLLEGECVSDDAGSYLAVTVNGNPKDPRTDEIRGDVISQGAVLPDWGLHLIDVHLGMGNLIDLVEKATAASAP
ncbi:MAG: DUF3089 domain-containing protein [Alphaproteobacteria bacterium]|nr:DUF3089 domain-containing protein [Alphaproteobacteria bacterium]